MSATPLSKMNKKQLYDECKTLQEKEKVYDKMMEITGLDKCDYDFDDIVGCLREREEIFEKYHNHEYIEVDEHEENLQEVREHYQDIIDELKKDVKLLQAQKNYYQVNLRAINYISSDAGTPIAPIIFDGCGPPETHEDLEHHYSYKAPFK